MGGDEKDTIIVRAPAGTKARWVQRSQAHGHKLNDWIIAAVDRPSNKLASTPCPRCASVVLTADGPGTWQCAQCGLAS